MIWISQVHLGISEGTLYLSEQISGTYQELGNYSITFAKAE